MMTRRRLMLTATAVLTAGARAPEIATWVGTALGADARLRIEGRGAEDALQEVLGIVDRLEAEFSLYRRLSSLSRLNAEGHLTPPPRPMVDLLHLARRIHTATRGMFDPTVQPLWRALAEGRDTGAALDAIGFDRVRVAPDSIELATGQALTLNGIAQGWITDRAVEALARRGFTRALVDLGEVRALGGPYRLGIDDPALGMLGTRTLNGTAISTSSPAALLLPGGAPHILGGPPRWSSVSVEAASAASADALSTAFCLMERDEIERTLAIVPDVTSATLISEDGRLITLTA